MAERKMYFENEKFETRSLDEFETSLHMTVGDSARYDSNDDATVPQVEVDVMGGNDISKVTYWIDVDKIDEVITMLAYAKHRITEETGYGKA